MILKRFNFICMIVVFSMGILLLFGCAGEKKDFEKAKQSNTISAYNEFLGKYPEGEYTKSVKNAIYNLEFEEAKGKNNIEGFQAFLQKYPEGEYTQSAKNGIYTLEFNKVKDENTITAYQKFIQKYPDSSLVDQAKEGIKSLLPPPSKIEFVPGKLDKGQITLKKGIVINMSVLGVPELAKMRKETDYTFTAHVLGPEGKKVDIQPAWTSSDPGIISITPASGNEVTVRGLKKGTTDIIIEAYGLKKIVKSIKVY